MSDYLSKEEIRQWRSSLEKITLEEYALRLGKTINSEKETNDLADIVLATNSSHSEVKVTNVKADTQKISQLPTLEEVAPKVTEVAKKVEVEIEVKAEKAPIKEPVAALSIKEEAKVNATPAIKETKAKAVELETPVSQCEVEFKKPLTDREQMVFEYFNKNRGKIVFAKDLAVLLSLPRDYVYKYIKNLRSKIAGDVLVNSDNGGYSLNL